MIDLIGYKIDISIHGQDALDKIIERVNLFKEDPSRPCYKVIFMDCNMPVKDGYQTSAEIKFNIQNKGWP